MDNSNHCYFNEQKQANYRTKHLVSVFSHSKMADVPTFLESIYIP